MRLCLKSPEISFVLPELAEAFPRCRFILAYRPVLEIAESMYRKGNEWATPSYHRRWTGEIDESGDLVAPPGVPGEWHGLWRTVSDFQRCVLYAASFVRAIALGMLQVSPDRIRVYDHSDLRARPSVLVTLLANFLDVEYSGFEGVISMIAPRVPRIPADLRTEHEAIEDTIKSAEWVEQLAGFCA
jgi:hypothetical protein